MTNKSLYILWAVLFALCAGLGFLGSPAGLDTWICMLTSVLFFVPPAVIVYRGWKEKNRDAIRLVRNLAMGSLALTLAMLVLNFLSWSLPVWVGDVLYAMLVILSTPMVCSQIWFVSLGLWAGLLWTCILLLGKKK